MIRPGRFFAWNRRSVWLGGTGLLLVGLGVGFLFSSDTAAIKSSWPYQTAIARAVADPRVSQALGAPVAPSWVVTGSVKERATLAVPLEGASKRGTLYVEAHVAATTWQFDKLEVVVEGAAPIDLLPY